MSQAARGCFQAVAGYAHDMGVIFGGVIHGAVSAVSTIPVALVPPAPSAPPGDGAATSYMKDGSRLLDVDQDPEMGEEPLPPFRQESVAPDSAANPTGHVDYTTPLLRSHGTNNPIKQSCSVVKKHPYVSAAVVLAVIVLAVGLSVGLTVKPSVPPISPVPEVCSLQGVGLVSGCAGAEISLFPGMNATQACGAEDSLITVISDIAGRVTIDAAKYAFSGNGQPFQISTAADPSAATVFLTAAGNMTATLAKAGAQLAVDVVASACPK